MRIGILTNSYPPNLNGVSMAVKRLEGALQAKGIKVFIATPKVPEVDYPEYILPIKSLPAPKDKSADLRVPYNYVDKCVQFFKKNQIDVLHTQDTFMGGIEGVIIAMRLNIPCVHTYHTFVESYDYFNFPGYKQFVRSYSQMVCDGYDHVIALSTKIYDYLTLIGVSTSISQLLNIPQPISNFTLKKPPLSQSPPVKELLRSSLLLPKGHGVAKRSFDAGNCTARPFTFITFGRVAKEKGLELGIEILAPLLQKYPNTRYLIAGNGPEMDNLKQLVKANNLQNQVEFSGAYTPETLPDLALQSDVFLITSTTENLPTTPLEAMSFGLPVIAINDQSYDYVLKNGYNGLKVEAEKLTEACEKIYLDQNLLQNLSQNAMETAKDFASRDIAQEYVDLYQKIINDYRLQKVEKVNSSLLFQNLEKMQFYFQEYFNFMQK